MLISRLTNDVQALDQLVTEGISTLFSATLTLVGTAVILVVLDPGLALITFLTFPVLLVASVAFRLASAGAYRLTREKIAQVTAYLQETLSGVRVVRAFGQEPRHRRRFAELNDEHREANMKTVYLNAAYFPSVELLSAVATAAILIYGGNEVIDGAVTIGVLATFVFYLQSFFDPIQSLSQLYTTYQAGMAALDKIFELLDEEPDVADKPDAVELPRVRGEIRFDDVTFSYGGDALALDRVSLDVPPGQTLALVGATGAGKSTLAKLVARFYDPDAGRVLIDGHDLRDVTERSLRSQLGIVPQESFLFSGTIRDNIAFGRPDATDEDVTRGGAGGGRARLHRAAAGRLRHRGGRARRAPVGGPAPARGVRARGGRGPAHPDPRRGHVERGRAHRGADRARPAPAARRAHGDRDRAPPLHDPRRRAASSCSTTAASPSRARTTSCSRRAAPTRASTATGPLSPPPDAGILRRRGEAVSLWSSGLAALLALPASASATVTMTDFKVEPSSKQGGGHPSVTITQAFSYDNTTDSVKDAFVRLQPGLLGNPQSAALCTQAAVPGRQLPGRLDGRAASRSTRSRTRCRWSACPSTSNGNVYNMKPTGDEPARLGIVVEAAGGLAKLFLQAPVYVRPGADGYGLESTFADQPRDAGVPIQITKIALTLNGQGSKGPFMRMPTSCAEGTSVSRANSWEAAGTFSQKEFKMTPTGCSSLAFTPKAEGSIGAPGVTGESASSRRVQHHAQVRPRGGRAQARRGDPAAVAPAEPAGRAARVLA